MEALPPAQSGYKPKKHVEDSKNYSYMASTLTLVTMKYGAVRGKPFQKRFRELIAFLETRFNKIMNQENRELWNRDPP